MYHNFFATYGGVTWGGRVNTTFSQLGGALLGHPEVLMYHFRSEVRLEHFPSWLSYWEASDGVGRGWMPSMVYPLLGEGMDMQLLTNHLRYSLICFKKQEI